MFGKIMLNKEGGCCPLAAITKQPLASLEIHSWKAYLSNSKMSILFWKDQKVVDCSSENVINNILLMTFDTFICMWKTHGYIYDVCLYHLRRKVRCILWFSTHLVNTGCLSSVCGQQVNQVSFNSSNRVLLISEILKHPTWILMSCMHS